MIVAFWIESLEADRVMQIELAQEIVDSLALAAREDVVHRRAEAIVSHRKGMAAAAGVLMSFDHRDPSPGFGQERRHGEPAHAGTDHDVVVEIILCSSAHDSCQSVPVGA